MPGILLNRKLLVFLALLVLVISIFGGILGQKFGGGFLGSPMAHIQLPAESISSSPVGELGFLGKIYITNTMIATWITILFLSVFAFLGSRKASEIPNRIQGFWEIVLELFITTCERVAGKEKGRIFFPLVMTIFLFIVTANWFGILPGFGTIGRVESPEEVFHHRGIDIHSDDHHASDEDLEGVRLQVFDKLSDNVFVLNLGSGQSVTNGKAWMDEHEHEHGHEEGGKKAGLLVPYFRSANTDINTPLAIAIVATIMIHFWGLSTLGIFGHIGKFINFKHGPIGFFVGILEALSEVARLVSFTFRLFGNIFAGEVLLIAMAFLIPLVGLIPFLGLEVFVGAIQAFIFSMLTLVFATAATSHH